MKKSALFSLLALCMAFSTQCLALGFPNAPFNKGVNLSDWFNHEDSKYLRYDTYTDNDFADMASMGIDVVRLPLNFKAFMDANNNYSFSSDFLTALDYAVDLALQHNMYVILDQHSFYGSRWFPDNGEEIVTSGLRQLAERYKDKNDKVVYELFNEPGGNCAESGWGEMQRRLIAAIRAIDTKHWIIATPYGCGIDNLWDLPEYSDSKLIYTFHFYKPFLFTHQGANWDGIPLQYISTVPFPYNRDTMPAKPSQFEGNAEYEAYYKNYPNEAITTDRMRDKIVTAVNWARLRNAPLFVGEFGTLTSVPNEDRCRWYKAVCDMLAKNGIAYTTWEYRKQSSGIDFGMFPQDKACIFNLSLNCDLAEAMGFKAPDLSSPQSICFYGDYPQSWWTPDYSDSNINFDCSDSPAEGSCCLSWKITGNYSTLNMPVWPVADFSAYPGANAKLEFSIKATEDISKINVRFVQYKSSVQYQWRNLVTVGTSTDVPDNHGLRIVADGNWHRVSVPLSFFWIWGTSGTGENWKNQPGSGDEGFAWDCVNALQFAAEGESSLIGKTVWIDDIRITVQ